MNVFRRGMIFLTFFGCCLAIALLAASLGTKYWIVGTAKRTSNPKDSAARVHFGLFQGKRELNVAYGWRTYDMNVVDILYEEREFMLYGLWVATIACVCGGVVFGLVAAIFAIINTATNPIEAVTGVTGLYIWNSLASVCNLAAVLTWVVQYHLKLKKNIMVLEDRQIQWNSDGLAGFGYSFWFIVGAMIVHVLNIIIIFIGNQERRDKKIPKQITDGKPNGAIMLY